MFWATECVVMCYSSSRKEMHYVSLHSCKSSVKTRKIEDSEYKKTVKPIGVRGGAEKRLKVTVWHDQEASRTVSHQLQAVTWNRFKK